MNRECHELPVFLEIAVHVSVLVVLEENAVHQILQVDSLVVFLVLFLRLFVSPNELPVFARGERRVDFFDNTSEERLRIRVIICDGEQALYVVVVLRIPEDAVVIKSGKLSIVGEVRVIERHRHVVLFFRRAYGDVLPALRRSRLLRSYPREHVIEEAHQLTSLKYSHNADTRRRSRVRSFLHPGLFQHGDVLNTHRQ